MIKGIIFDIDGVILDSMMIWHDLGKRYIQSCQKEPEENLNSILFSMSMEGGAAYMKDRYQLSQSIGTIVEEVGKLIENFYFEEAKAKTGIRELMDYCKNNRISMIAATSSMRKHVTRAIVRNGLDGYLSEILTTGEVGVSKHEPLIFNMAAKRMNTLPQETVVLEDSLYALETAKSAGFITVGVYDGYGETQQEKLASTGEAYIRDLKEVIQFIKRKDENDYEDSIDDRRE